MSIIFIAYSIKGDYASIYISAYSILMSLGILLTKSFVSSRITFVSVTSSFILLKSVWIYSGSKF